MRVEWRVIRLRRYDVAKLPIQKRRQTRDKK